MYSDVIDKLQNSGSDKEWRHRYGMLYELAINSLILKFQRNLNIMEIGCSFWRNASAEVFSNLECVDLYVGIDINDYPDPIENPKFEFIKTENAYELGFVKSLQDKYGKTFDIIIDDGNHFTVCQKWFLSNYTRLCRSGGMLFCEDITDLDFAVKSNAMCFDFRMLTGVDHSLMLVKTVR